MEVVPTCGYIRSWSLRFIPSLYFLQNFSWDLLWLQWPWSAQWLPAPRIQVCYLNLSVCGFLSAVSISVCRHLHSAGCSCFLVAVLARTKTSVATEVPSRLNSSVLNNSSGKLKHLHRIPGFILLSSFSCFEIKSPVVMKEVWSVEAGGSRSCSSFSCRRLQVSSD